MRYITSMEMAEKYGVTKRYVNYLCNNGMIEDAKKVGYRWMIPDTAVIEKVRSRVTEQEKVGNTYFELGNNVCESENNYNVMGNQGTNLPLPIGISDFRLAITEYYYVDKTLFIKDLLDNQPLVSLFTRPRRFGKTLNMDMLRVFFEISEEDTEALFKNTHIGRAGEKYMEKQGKYPVIFLTFKDIKYNNWEDTLLNLQASIQSEFRRHQELLTGEDISEFDKEYIQKVLRGELETALWPATLENLSRLLDEYYGVAPIIIIDEYDTPIQQGYLKDFYDDIILFMRNLLSGGLKDNRHLTMAFLTGILRVAKESIFSGLNNLKVNSILEERYSQYFGFTESEVRQMAKDFGHPEKFQEIKDWYDGYRFGSQYMFNPWSVLNYIDSSFLPRTYWLSTGSNEIIGEIIAQASQEQIEEMNLLLDGRTIETYIDTSVVYPSIQDNPSSVYSFLLMAGYLTVQEGQELYDGNSLCKVSIPNQEILFVYEKEIINRWSNIISPSVAIGIQQALMTQNVGKLQKEIERFLQESVSYYDVAAEGFYHGMLLGMTAMLHRYYWITSNLESGLGRYDIQLEPKKKKYPAFLIEAKTVQKSQIENIEVTEQLEQLARKALEQINEMQYETQLTKKKYNSIVKIGIAFYKKHCAIAKETEQ